MKPHPTRSPSIKVLHDHVLVVQCGTRKILPARGTYPSIIAPSETGVRKPPALIRQHLELWSPPIDLIVDPFAGSGSSVESWRLK